ncbi:7135_t:CDS:10 [Funneliformis mosseae]|uniref:7135_t:CDS:1 n=1 Tax=Funneliformis mosseae TaxID=27381 RepID=A0A9N8W1R6_FUNMO|nr:7135_t:CDS:10 [Funneliformis mosseae]
MSNITVSGTAVNLWCSENRAIFKIIIGVNNDLYDLRKAILEELPNAENVKAIQLTLWRVKVASSVFRNKDIDIDTYLNDELEDSSDTVGNAFQNVEGSNIRVVVGVPVTADPSQQSVPLEQVLRFADSYWEELKKESMHPEFLQLIISLFHFAFITGLSGFDNNSHEGYLHKNMLSALFKKVMGNPWLFLMGTSGYFVEHMELSLNAGNGSKNLGSQDMDISITDLGEYLTANDPEKNTRTALKFTRAMLLGRLFIHKQRNFTPKNWLILQLLPRKFDGNDFWVTISRVFRQLSSEDQDVLVVEFIKKFKTLIPQQKQLPMQLMNHKQPSLILQLSAGNLCLVRSGTGMSFDDIKLNAESGGATFRNFFSIHDGFYEFQFLEHALLDTSSMSQNDVNKNVEIWQRNGFDFIITTFMKSCFPNLRKKKEAWNKVLNIMILSLFSHHTKLVKGDGIAEMVQYGFPNFAVSKSLVKQLFVTFDDKNSTILCSNGNMKKENLPGFLKNPTTAFFMPEKYGPDLAKLVKGAAKDPHHLYPHGEKRTGSKERLRKEVLDCLKSKYCKAHELSWIRFLAVFHAEAKVKSKYIIHEDSRPRRSVASNFNDPKANELIIVIDSSNAEHFFTSFGHNMLKETYSRR